MQLLINPYMFATGGGGFTDAYAMKFTVPGAFYTNNPSNSINTLINSGTPAFTVSTWVYVDEIPSKLSTQGFEPAIIGTYNQTGGRGFYIYLAPTTETGNWAVYGQDTGVHANLRLQSNSSTVTGWTHFVFTYDSTQTNGTQIAKIFLNGAYNTLASSTASTSTTAKSFVGGGVPVTIGTVYSGGAAIPANFAGNFSGRQNEVSFWYGALTETQVNEIYNGGVPTALTGTTMAGRLLSWFRMGDASGDVFTSPNWVLSDQGTGSSTNLSSSTLTAAAKVAYP